MKKLLALILAFMLALSCTSAFAEALPLDPNTIQDPIPEEEPLELDFEELFAQATGTITAKMTVDVDTVKGLFMLASMMNTESLPMGTDIKPILEKIVPMLDPVLALVNNAAFRVSMNEKGAEMDVLLQNTPIATIAAVPALGGLALSSSLIPHNIILADKEAVSAIAKLVMEQMKQTSAATQIDVNGLMTAVVPHVMRLIFTVQSRIGEPEEGNYVFEDGEFELKMPINITAKEAILLVLNTAKDILNEEAVVSVLQQAAEAAGAPLDLDLSGLDEIIANVEETFPDPEEAPEAEQEAAFKDIEWHVGELEDAVIETADALEEAVKEAEESAQAEADLTEAREADEAAAGFSEITWNVSELEDAVIETEDAEEPVQSALPTLEAAIYRNHGDENVYFDLTLSANGQALNVHGGNVEGNLLAHLNFNDEIAAAFGAMHDGETVVIASALNVGGMFLGATAQAALADEEKHVTLEAYFLDSQKPALTMDVQYVPDVDLANTTRIITLSQLMSGSDDEIAQNMTLDFMLNGINDVMGKMMQAMPEEISALMGQLSSQAPEAAQ